MSIFDKLAGNLPIAGPPTGPMTLNVKAKIDKAFNDVINDVIFENYVTLYTNIIADLGYEKSDVTDYIMDKVEELKNKHI